MSKTAAEIRYQVVHYDTGTNYLGVPPIIETCGHEHKTKAAAHRCRTAIYRRHAYPGHAWSVEEC